MNRHLYIYYRVPVVAAEALRQRATAMQRSLASEYGIVARLLRRPEEKDGRHTWMEVYEAVPPDFEQVLEHACMQAGLAALIDGPRHTEIFVG